MAGNDSSSKADGGQVQETDQQRQHDGNAVVLLAEALTRQLQAITSGNASYRPTLSTQQVRLTTHYGALTNMLGNFGRHGSPRAGILSPPPQLINNDSLLVFTRSIPGAATVVTYDGGGGLLERLCFSRRVTVTKGNRIQTVEIENQQGFAFLVGFVTRPVTSDLG